MMMMPPEITSRDAQRSRTIRRAVRLRETTSGRAGIAGPPARTVSGLTLTYWIFPSSSLAMLAGIGK